MTIATMTVKGQITIPKAIRDLLKLHPGDRVDFVVRGEDTVVIHPIRTTLDDLFGILHQPDQATVTLEEMEQAIQQGAGRTLEPGP